MTICKNTVNTIYIADQTHLWKTTNGGSSWDSKDANLPGTGNILSIAVKDDNPNIVWITLSGYLHDGVYQSNDGGDTWSSISDGLPQIPIYTIVWNKLENSRIDLFVGTELGVYYKAGDANWVSYNSGLPNVMVSELEIYYNLTYPEQSRLRAATYGRGLWEAPMVENPNFVPSVSLSEYGIKIFPNPGQGEINVQIDRFQKNMMLIVKDLAGKTILSKKVDKKLAKLNLSKQSKGLYFIEISWQGERITSKFIIE
jgi:xyloglucan-specific exo-beta-1,4-glucanase